MIIFLGDDTNYKDIINESKNDDVDIVVSCQYRYLVPKSLLDSHICVNIHFGELPYFAGCNPIYWQIIKSDSAGVTLHYMDNNFDSGDIIDIYRIPISDMNADELYYHLNKAGSVLFKRWYKKILNGTAPRKKQDLSKRTYYQSNNVDFKKDNLVSDIHDKKKIQALHFKGKQFPEIFIGSRKYEIRCCDTCL